MLKAAGRTGDGRPLLILGLTEDTVTRLKASEPMLLDTELMGMGLPIMQIIIVHGQTENDLIKRLHAAKLLDLGPDPASPSAGKPPSQP